jgi:hypothetical protein
MKRVVAAFSLITTVLFLTSCGKKEPNVAPEPDTELESARQASHALQTLSDIDMICSYIAENQFYNNSYVNAPLPANGTITANRDQFSPLLVFSFYQTTCVDGKFRDGSVFLNYSLDPLFKDQTPNSRYMREKGFAGRFTLTQYLVDNWRVENVGGGEPLHIYNTLKSEQYDPAETKLTWYIGGKFKMTKVNAPDSSMTVEFRINKTLANSTSTVVFPAKKDNKNVDIRWGKAIVEYDGEVTGTTLNGDAFTLTISKETPLTRDWSCSPNAFMGVVATATPGVFLPITEQYHPFVKGVATFVTGKKYPRQVYYGNEGDPTLESQCDNNGVILIQGNSYKVNFYK